MELGESVFPGFFRIFVRAISDARAYTSRYRPICPWSRGKKSRYNDTPTFSISEYRFRREGSNERHAFSFSMANRIFPRSVQYNRRNNSLYGFRFFRTEAVGSVKFAIADSFERITTWTISWGPIGSQTNFRKKVQDSGWEIYADSG